MAPLTVSYMGQRRPSEWHAASRRPRGRFARREVSKARHPRNYWCPWTGAYCLHVGDSEHPGGTWGAYIEDAAKRPGWNSKKLAEAAGVGRATLYRWRSGTTGVTVHSVRKLAAALGDDLEHALAAAGGRLVNDSDDPELSQIYASEISDAEKAELVEYVLEQRLRDRERREEHVRRLLRAHGAA